MLKVGFIFSVSRHDERVRFLVGANSATLCPVDESVARVSGGDQCAGVTHTIDSIAKNCASLDRIGVGRDGASISCGEEHKITPFCLHVFADTLYMHGIHGGWI